MTPHNRTKMDIARDTLRTWIETAGVNERVASVASLSAAVGDVIAKSDGRERAEAGDMLATGPTVAVLNEAKDAGWLWSTRGPLGGYWRTAKRSYRTLDQAMENLEGQLASALDAIAEVREMIRASEGGTTTRIATVQIDSVDLLVHYFGYLEQGEHDAESGLPPEVPAPDTGEAKNFYSAVERLVAGNYADGKTWMFDDAATVEDDSDVTWSYEYNREEMLAEIRRCLTPELREKQGLKWGVAFAGYPGM